MPPMRLSSVLLPEPDGPEDDQQLAGLDGQVDVAERGHLDFAHAEHAGDMFDAKECAVVHVPCSVRARGAASA